MWGGAHDRPEEKQSHLKPPEQRGKHRYTNIQKRQHLQQKVNGVKGGGGVARAADRMGEEDLRISLLCGVVHKIQLIIVAHETLTDVNTHQCRNKKSINLLCQKQLHGHTSTSTQQENYSEILLPRTKCGRKQNFVFKQATRCRHCLITLRICSLFIHMNIFMRGCIIVVLVSQLIWDQPKDPPF